MRCSHVGQFDAARPDLCSERETFWDQTETLTGRLIGDLRDLAKQGMNWARGEETDAVIAVLPRVGLIG